MSFEDAIATFDPVMGFEVHVELNTLTKMFCGCPTEFGAPPNTQVCPVCLGLPGALPVVNEKAVESAIRIGLALGCSIAEWSRFARKNYFYPDMPKDFQTSQYDEPIAFNGALEILVETEGGRRSVTVEIERAHMEEDTGKILHVGGATGRIHGADYSLIDYNRAGVPLIEIVTKPIEVEPVLAPAVARAYVTELRELIVALGVSDAHMHQGSMRVDANLSLKPRGRAEFGTRTETKNVNSIRSVERAVRFEIQRQAAVLQSGGTIIQETRHFHESDGSTTSGRVKEEAEDYRYFPEPDLTPVAPDATWIETLRATLPEPPLKRRARIREEWGITEHDMQSLINAGALELVEQTVALGADSADARKWWMGEIARISNERGLDIVQLPITPADVYRIITLTSNGSLNDKLARQVIEGVLAGEGGPDEVVAARGLAVVSDDGALLEAVDAALAAQPDVAAKIRDGKVQAAGAIVGAVMKATAGKADAGRVRELILERVGASPS
ncbi:MAG: Asp-tRNA(Asn)/Glu-tRNA(Gln) amidotransferase subunit GatB [Actinomycetia bacterium]|nr:Asp-tRNA(Asn)/Glu-tRNA(Gln) amidotransferase subunit GatB [Actinomycetes bacterium]